MAPLQDMCMCETVFIDILLIIKKTDQMPPSFDFLKMNISLFCGPHA